MAEFVECQNSLKPSLSFIEIEQSLDVMSHYEGFNAHTRENPNLGFMGYSNDNFLPFLENFSGHFPIECPKPAMISAPGDSVEVQKKRKAEAVSQTNSVSSSVSPSEARKKNRGGSNTKEVEKPKEVFHVRARRGQATDSHSLAERVRRERINERMKCLQDLVPGCYKVIASS